MHICINFQSFCANFIVQKLIVLAITPTRNRFYFAVAVQSNPNNNLKLKLIVINTPILSKADIFKLSIP